MALRGEAHGGSFSLAPSRSDKSRRSDKLLRSEKPRRSSGLRRGGRSQRRERPPSRWRWLAWAAGSLALLLGLLLAIAVWLGHNLERSWLKPRLIARVKA